MINILKKIIICFGICVLGYLLLVDFEKQGRIKSKFIEKTGIVKIFGNNPSVNKVIETIFSNLHFVLLLTPICFLGKFFNFVIYLSFLTLSIINYSLHFKNDTTEFIKYLTISLCLITCVKK